MEQVDQLRKDFQHALDNNESTESIMDKLDSLLQNKISEVIRGLSDSDSEESLEFDQESSDSEDQNLEDRNLEEQNYKIKLFMEKLQASTITNALSDNDLLQQLQKIEDEVFQEL